MGGGCTADGGLDDSQFTKPIPWVGAYIAAASLLCAILMAADTARGFRQCRLWFPCKYFSLNATTLTLLGIATKLPVDLSSPMPSRQDQLSKLTATVFTCTFMANVMPCLGTMGPSDSLSNIVALGILVITVVVNVIMQMATGAIYVFLPEHAVVIFLMLALLVVLASTSAAVPAAKRLVEEKFAKEKSKWESGIWEHRVPKLDQVKEQAKKLWVMAHSGSPQCVVGRSATCVASGALCLAGALVLIEATVRSFIATSTTTASFCKGGSDYRWSTKLVVVAQGMAVVLGTVAPAVRWFRDAISSWGSRDELRRRFQCKDAFQVESYWAQPLEEWKEGAPLPFKSHRMQLRRYAYYCSVDFPVSVLEAVQFAAVVASKFLRFASELPVTGINRLLLLGETTSSAGDGDPVAASGGAAEDLYVMYLEGESDSVVKFMLKSGREDADRWMQRGRESPSRMTEELIERNDSIRQGYGRFPRLRRTPIPLVIPEESEPPNGWSLYIVILASIAALLPHVDKNGVQSLLLSVDEALRYVRFVEKNLMPDNLPPETLRTMAQLGEAADSAWRRVILCGKWFDEDMDNAMIPPGDTTGKRVIEWLAEIGRKKVEEFIRNRIWPHTDDSLQWDVHAANCMNRVTSTILEDYDNFYGTEDVMFRRLERTISDAMAVCLANLPLAAYMGCLCLSIDRWEENVREAVSVLGGSEAILRKMETSPLMNEDLWSAFLVRWLQGP